MQDTWKPLNLPHPLVSFSRMRTFCCVICTFSLSYHTYGWRGRRRGYRLALLVSTPRTSFSGTFRGDRGRGGTRRRLRRRYSLYERAQDESHKNNGLTLSPWRLCQRAHPSHRDVTEMREQMEMWKPKTNHLPEHKQGRHVLNHTQPTNTS